MFKICVEAETLEELKAKTGQLLDAFSLTQKVMAAAPVEVEVAEVKEEAPKKTTKKKSAKKTTKKAAKKEEAPAKSAHVITADDCMKSLQAVNTALGLAAVRKILGGFGADRLSSLEEKDYEGFVQACTTEIANAPEIEA